MEIFIGLLVAGALLVAVWPIRSRFAAATVTALTAFIFLPAQSLSVGSLSSIAGILVGLAALLIAMLTSGRRLIVGWPVWLMLVPLALGELSAALNVTPNMYAMVAAVGGPLVLVVARSLSPRERMAVLTSIALLGLIQATFCVAEVFVLGSPLFAPEAYGENPFVAGAVRGQGTLSHPLVAALVMLGALGAAMVMKAWLPLKVSAVVVLTAGIVATGSSSAIVATLFCVVAAFLVAGSAGSRLVRALLVIAGALFVLFSAVIPTQLTSDIGGVNANHRLNSIVAIPRLVTHRELTEALFGSGWGSAQSLYERDVLINDNFFAIDNQFVTILATTGVVGLVAFMVFLGAVLFLTRGTLRIVVLSFVVMFVSFDVLSWVATASVVFAIIGVALANVDHPARNLTPRRRGTDSLAVARSANAGLRPPY